MLGCWFKVFGWYSREGDGVWVGGCDFEGNFGYIEWMCCVALNCFVY